MEEINAKTEFLGVVRALPSVKCASITYDNRKTKENKDILLKVGYTKEDWESFLDSLNFNYDSGYGTQHLFGIVWLYDGTWLERSEYDGAEGWDYKRCPLIPVELI